MIWMGTCEELRWGLGIITLFEVVTAFDSRGDGGGRDEEDVALRGVLGWVDDDGEGSGGSGGDSSRRGVVSAMRCLEFLLVRVS